MASLVVIQLDALRGLTTTQLADYAAMRVFARTQPSRLQRSTAPTILNIIDTPMNAQVPLTLTQWDLGFLRAGTQRKDDQNCARTLTQRHPSS